MPLLRDWPAFAARSCSVIEYPKMESVADPEGSVWEEGQCAVSGGDVAEGPDPR